MQRTSQLALLVLVLAASVSQAQTSRSSGSYSNRIDDSETEADLNGARTDYDAPSTTATPRSVMPGFGFLRNISKTVISEFYKAWQLSHDGTSGREAVVLIFRMEDGSYTGKALGFTNQYMTFTFRWDPAALAIVHTHPNNCDPRPSQQDQRVAEKYDVPIFTITRSGMYVYNPATGMTSKVVHGLDWLKLSKLQETGAGAERLPSDEAIPHGRK